MHKLLLTTLGLFFVGLAAIGVVLPGLPATPFLLLAVACFANSSEKLHRWILASSVFGPVIKDWQETRSIPRKAKFYAFISIIVTGAISLSFTEGTAAKVVSVLVLLIPAFIILKIRSTESRNGN
jgi:uncharacterized membrane protein YbaN (DUF454 family)